jgi:cytochrome c-type biogenesis protein CcmH/NrfG
MEGDSTKGIAANPALSKEQFQEAANYLQKFIDIAPPDNKLVASVKDSINDLKNTQNLTPQKGKTTTTKKKN